MVAPSPLSYRLDGRRLIEVAAELAAVARVAQLAQRLGLDLADALAGDAELAADLFERAELAVLQAEAKDDDFALALGELAQRVANLRLEQLLRGELERVRHRLVFDEVAEEGVAVLADRGFERDRVAGDVEHLADLVVRNVHRPGDLFLRRLALEDLLQAMPGLLDPVDRLADMDRQADRAALVGDRAGDRLADPPGGVGAEFEAALVVELVGGLHQADVAFLDQIQEGEAATDVFFGDGDDQAEIGLDQVRAGKVAVELV